MKMTKLIAMTLFEPAGTFGPLIARMDAGPTSGAAGFHPNSVGTRATDGHRTSRFPLAGIHLRASVKIGCITARNVGVVGGVFGIIRHGNPNSKIKKIPHPKERPPKQSGVRKV